MHRSLVSTRSAFIEHKPLIAFTRFGRRNWTFVNPDARVVNRQAIRVTLYGPEERRDERHLLEAAISGIGCHNSILKGRDSPLHYHADCLVSADVLFAGVVRSQRLTAGQLRSGLIDCQSYAAEAERFPQTEPKMSVCPHIEQPSKSAEFD